MDTLQFVDGELKTSTTIIVYTGPMFSGKTTAIYAIIKEQTSKCVVFTHTLNIHRNDKKEIQYIESRTYFNPIVCKKIDKLSYLCDNKIIEEYRSHGTKYIIIDEIQFFDDLMDFIIFYKNLDFIIILCGLELDYKKNKFGYLYKLENENYVTYNRLNGKCTYCDSPSVYTLRVVLNPIQVLIGDDSYTACCSSCYDKYAI